MKTDFRWTNDHAKTLFDQMTSMRDQALDGLQRPSQIASHFMSPADRAEAARGIVAAYGPMLADLIARFTTPVLILESADEITAARRAIDGQEAR